jgi:serine/threonine protein kinase
VLQESIQGVTLRQFIDDVTVKEITLKQQLEIALSIARGLAYLHRMGLFHGDLKVESLHLNSNNSSQPTNIWIDTNSLRTKICGHEDPKPAFPQKDPVIKSPSTFTAF